MIQQQKQILESLHEAKIARLATVDPENNQPHIVPVVFAFDGKNIFIPIDDKPKAVNSNRLKRIQNIQKNPNVSFLIDTYDNEDWNNLSYLLIQGKARITDMTNDKDDVKKAHSLLSDKYIQYKNMIVGIGNKCIVIDIYKAITWKYSN